MFSGGGLFVTNKHPGKTKTFVFKVKEGHQDMLMCPIKKKTLPLFSHKMNVQIISIPHR